MRKFLPLLAAAAAAAAISAPAHATAFGIKSVVIQHAGAADWLQVAEVIALNTLGTNVAATSNGGTATSSGQYAGTGYLVQSGAGNTINGTIGGNYFSGTAADWIFHSDSTSTAEFLKITFSSAANLSSLQIYGRTDCCGPRDIYNVTLLDASDAVVASYANLSANNTAHLATLTFTADVGSPVPEPGTWALMLAGCGLTGLALRRRKSGQRVRLSFA